MGKPIEREHVPGLIAALLISQHSRKALDSLGYCRYVHAYRDLGRHFAMNPNTIKDMRDQFDHLHQGERAGFDSDPGSSRRNCKRILGRLTCRRLASLVIGLRDDEAYRQSAEIEDLCTQIRQPIGDRTNRRFTPRGPTAAHAETYFEHWYGEHKAKQFPDTQLEDRRLYGCGYDYRIVGADRTLLVEVKGLDKSTGPLSFTDKEWRTALDAKRDYWVFVVYDLGSDPHSELVKDTNRLTVQQRECPKTETTWQVQFRPVGTTPRRQKGVEHTECLS